MVMAVVVLSASAERSLFPLAARMGGMAVMAAVSILSLISLWPTCAASNTGGIIELAMGSQDGERSSMAPGARIWS